MLFRSREDVVAEVGKGGEGFNFEVVGGGGEEEGFGDFERRRFPEGGLRARCQREGGKDDGRRTSMKLPMRIGTQRPLEPPRGVQTVSQPNSSRISAPSSVDEISPRAKQAVLRRQVSEPA